MKNGLGAAVLLVASLAAQVSLAADLTVEVLQQCAAKSMSSLPDLDEEELSLTLRSYFDAGRDGMKDERVVGSRSPAFTWAYETRLACGEALGYLDGGYIDRVSVQQCDCFYQRYISYR